MKSKWLTFWTLEYTFIWIILRNILPCNKFITNINPTYLLLLIAYGYLAIVFYQLIVNKTYYEFSFLVAHILFHFIPLFLFQMFFSVKGNLLFSSLFVVAYLCYINTENIFGYLINNYATQQLAIQYSKWVFLGIYFVLASFVFQGFYTGIEKTKIHMYATVGSNLVNLYFNIALRCS